MKDSTHTPFQELCIKQPILATNYNDAIKLIKNTFGQKQLLYGPKNVTQGEDISIPENRFFCLLGLWFRMNDKMSRIKNIVRNPSINTGDESLSDTFLDLANYALIGYLVTNNLWVTDEKTTEDSQGC